MKNAAAIILCAGKGTRMNDDSKNKVCFDCAGTPVIKRIIENMRLGGVSRFVIVIGHQAYSVMDCLDGVDGIVYAYQKEQKGTGHAALCGLNALKTIGYSGPAIISMGDKIIAPEVVSELIEHSLNKKAVWGVQPLDANYNGGRVVVADGKPYGVVEFADAALMMLANEDPSEYESKLKQIRLNPSKASKVIKLAEKCKPSGVKTLCGREFSAEQILYAPFSNAGLYCFDVAEAVNVIQKLGNRNAQGEIYLTDALEHYALEDDVVLYEVKDANAMLTYSTKRELRAISKHFMHTATEFARRIQAGDLDETFRRLYCDECETQKKRYISLLELFVTKYGDKKVIVTRAPGRVNLMGRHIDHRGGGINVMATDKDTVLVVASRDDDRVNISNIDPLYRDQGFSIGQTLNLARHDTWLEYLADDKVVAALKESKGDWSNYVKSAVLRLQMDQDFPLYGMDMVAGGTIPVAAGLSSSSSIVVATMEAAVALNCLNISDDRFITLCGEGEWFVGSRGGAGDHAAMKCGRKDAIVHLDFKPFQVGETARFSGDYAVIVANSMLMAKKSEGSKDKFNAKVAAYEFSLMLLKRAYPQYNFQEFRDIAKIRPYSEIYNILKSIPETMTRGGLKALLPEYREQLERIFANHADPYVYELRGVSLYGISECVRAEKFMDALNSEDYELIGRYMKVSHDGDRLTDMCITDAFLDSLAENNADIALQYGAYGCSTERIDYLCDVLNQTDGVLGSEIVGAGLGGCVVALVEKEKSEQIISTINREYYDRYGYEYGAKVYLASDGSAVLY